MTLFEILFGPRTYTGIAEDPRPETEKRRDYLHEERSMAGAEDPFYSSIEVSFPKEDQKGTLACVPHAVGLALGIERALDSHARFTRLWALFAYRLRANYPGEGCWLQNIFEVYRIYGAPQVYGLPPPSTETAANEIVLTPDEYLAAEIYRGGEYYQLQVPNSTEKLATIAHAGHGVVIIIFATYAEWAQEYPQIKNKKLTREGAAVRHAVTVLPYGGVIKNGKRYLKIQDSAQFGGYALRYLSEEFVSLRVVEAGYWDTVKLIGSGKAPKHVFTKSLTVGARGADVTAFQQLLVSEGLLPNDCTTGFFAGRTLAGLHAFQNKYAAEILAPLALDVPTDVFGSMSIAVANRLCA